VLTPVRAIELLTSGPAGAFGLPGGHLAPGAPGDVTLVDPGAEWTVDAARFQSKSRNTPYDGLKVTGQVVRTVVGGRTVWPLEERR
ncbi:MAG: amidohydrolase family protein, partial [Myxococcaceae bacterium]